jgi:hypothetical protein
MALSKQDAPKAEAKPSPPAEDQEPIKFVPDRSHPSYDTPSGRALSKVGAPDPDGDEAKELERGLRYAAEKHKLRWGY